MSRMTPEHAIVGAIRAVPVVPRSRAQAPRVPEPFVTISREAGAGAWTLARQLVESFNAADPQGRPWTCWDRELVERVASEHHLAERDIERMEDSSPSWVVDLLGSLKVSNIGVGPTDENGVFLRVSQTIRALAQAGRVVIVGRGGVFVTRKMPGGIHVRLVAPFEHRVEFMMGQLHRPRAAVEVYLRELDRNREAFYRRHFGRMPVGPEVFAITLNAGEVDAPTMVKLLSELVRARTPARSNGGAGRPADDLAAKYV